MSSVRLFTRVLAAIALGGGMIVGLASLASAASDADPHTIVRADLPADAPRFKDYTVPVYTGKLAQPAVRADKRSWLFRTELREAAAEGANFAGHYRLTSWGCGTACFQWAIIDVKSGRVFHPANLASTEHQYVEESLYEGGIHAVHLRPDSRLLVVIGGINEDPKQRGISWFEWDGKQLKRIRFVAKPYGKS
jgi:hypothetical protein